MMGYGYTTESGVEIPALIDMIDGGGAGQSGDRFEGGGILSLLANMVADPYGSVRDRPGFVEEDIVARGTAAPAAAPVAEPSIDEISPRAATEQDVEVLRRIGGTEYFDIQPGDLLSITEVQMIEEAGNAPAPAPSTASAPTGVMTAAPQLGAAPSGDMNLRAPFGIDAFLFAPRTAPTGPAVVASQAPVPGPAGVPSTLEEIERMRLNPQSPNFTFDMFGGP